MNSVFIFSTPLLQREEYFRKLNFFMCIAYRQRYFFFFLFLPRGSYWYMVWVSAVIAPLSLSPFTQSFNERINLFDNETPSNNCIFLLLCAVILEVDSCWMPGYGVRQCVHGRCVQQQQTDGTTHSQCVCDPGYAGPFCTESEYLL